MMRILKCLLLLLLIFTVFIFIWVLLPLEDSGFEIKESNYFICSSINIQLENAQILDEVVNFKFKEEYGIESKWVRWAVKSCGRFLLPLNFSLIARPKEGDLGDFDYLAVIKSARAVRLIQIPLALYRLNPDFSSKKLGNWLVLEAKDKDDDLQRLAWYADTILLSSDERMFNNLLETNTEKGKLSDKALLKILINNKHGFFEHYVDELKDKASYDIFRSADKLRKISISLLASDEALNHKGYMVFHFEVGSDLTSSNKDVCFFMQLIRRVMNANAYTFNYKLEESISSVKVQYNLQKNGGKNQ